MAMMPCSSCGRQISDQSTRCLYCARPVGGAAGGSGAAAATDRQEDEARQARLYAMYSAGFGLPSPGRRRWIDRMREESIGVKFLVIALLAPFVVVFPFRTVGAIQKILRG